MMELELGQSHTWEDLNTSFTEKWAGYPKDAILQLLRRGQLWLLILTFTITHLYHITDTSRTYLCSKELCEHLCCWVSSLQVCADPQREHGRNMGRVMLCSGVVLVGTVVFLQPLLSK